MLEIAYFNLINAMTSSLAAILSVSEIQISYNHLYTMSDICYLLHFDVSVWLYFSSVVHVAL